jgi:hypothetical protein
MKKLCAFAIYSIFYFIPLLLIPVLSFSQDDVSSSFTVSGKVYDKATEKPLMGALINITNTENGKKISGTLTVSDGSYNFTMQALSNIKVAVTMDGYKKAERSFTREELRRYEYRLPGFYLDTVIKIVIPPSKPKRESRQQFISSKLAALNLVPVPAAYDLLVYLNPDLGGRDSLMSNDKIVLPKMPRVSGDIKRQNKKQFQSDKDKDHATQNRLRDSIDKLIRILGDDISRYKIKYDRVNPGNLKQMREYMLMDLQGFKERISKTSKLKAEQIMQLLNKIGIVQDRVIAQSSIQIAEYERMKILWEDLSYLLLTKRYMLFTKAFDNNGNETAIVSINDNHLYSGPAAGDDAAEMITPAHADGVEIKTEPYFDQDEVGVFGFVIWSPEVTSKTKPDLAEPSDRYVIRYFIPAFKDDKGMYRMCSRNANVAIANLTRARYGVEVYDTKQKKYVEPLYPTFTTEEAFTDKGYDALLVPDFKEIKYIPIRLK